MEAPPSSAAAEAQAQTDRLTEKRASLPPEEVQTLIAYPNPSPRALTLALTQALTLALALTLTLALALTLTLTRCRARCAAC